MKRAIILVGKQLDIIQAFFSLESRGISSLKLINLSTSHDSSNFKNITLRTFPFVVFKQCFWERTQEAFAKRHFFRQTFFILHTFPLLHRLLHRPHNNISSPYIITIILKERRITKIDEACKGERCRREKFRATSKAELYVNGCRIHRRAKLTINDYARTHTLSMKYQVLWVNTRTSRRLSDWLTGRRADWRAMTCLVSHAQNTVGWRET